ncbi:MAG: CHAD domain-containing protein [Thermoplasmata archaeon]|nr:CHAD domain-containing protein [Thermoplasmata archaeon]
MAFKSSPLSPEASTSQELLLAFRAISVQAQSPASQVHFLHRALRNGRQRREVIRTLSGGRPTVGSAAVREDLRSIETSFGLWRDYQVALGLLSVEHWSDVSEEAQHWLTAARSTVRSQRRAHARQTSNFLRAVLARRPGPELRLALEVPAVPQGARAQRAWIAASCDRSASLRDALDSATTSPSKRRVHHLRQEIRRSRLLASLNPFGTEPELPRRLPKLTSALGRIHDLDRLREITRGAAGDRGRKEVRRTIRRTRDRQLERLVVLLQNRKLQEWASRFPGDLPAEWEGTRAGHDVDAALA